MEVTAALDAACPPEALFAHIEDLAQYPDWLDIVPRARVAEADSADVGPAWIVDLRGRLGPLARSKRLRMVRTEHDPPTRVRFERREIDGRDHATWVLDARVDEVEEGSRLIMGLHYGGGFAGGLLERMLTDEIESSRPRLRALVEDDPPPAAP